MNRSSRSKRSRRAIVLLSFAASILYVAAPLGQIGPSREVRGRVVAADTGLALRRARVAVTSGAVQAEAVLTDDDGRFLVPGVSDGPIAVGATKAGYASTSVRSTRRGDVDLHLEMQRGAVISGRVFDGYGAPAVGATVVARRVGADAVGRGEQDTFWSATDDLGEYRIGGLPAGRYTAGVLRLPQPLAGLPPGSPVTLESIQRAIPGTETAIAGVRTILTARPVAAVRQAVDLRAGDESRGLDILLPPQPLPPVLPFCGGNGVIQGRVLAATGEPLAGVTVRITNRPLAMRDTTTGRSGAYAFTCLPPGDYTFEAGRAGHVRSGPGSTAVTTLQVRARQTVTAPDLIFDRAGAITGLVIDEHGEPIEGATVRSLQVQYARGRMTAVAAGAERRTDDRGHFRVFGLTPGAHILVASVDASVQGRGRGALGYAPLYYPGTTAIDAAAQIPTEAGMDVSGLSLVFRPSPAARVTGTALDASGAPVVGSVLLAVSDRSGAVAPDPVVLPIGPGGTFGIPNVPPGDYVVHAVATPGPGRSAEFGSEYVSVVDRSPDPLTIRTSTGATLEGRLTIEGEGPENVRSRSFTLMAYPSDPDRTLFAGRGSGFVVQSDGSFYGVGLYGPRQIRLATAPPGWYLKAVTVNGADVTDSGFDLAGASVARDAVIVLSTAGASVTGRTVDARGDPAAASVIVLPVQRVYWTTNSRHLKLARSKDDGSFDVRGLPPGDYWVAAVVDLETGPAGDAWQNPALLEALAAGAERVTLGESEARVLDVPLVPRR